MWICLYYVWFVFSSAVTIMVISGLLFLWFDHWRWNKTQETEEYGDGE